MKLLLFGIVLLFTSANCGDQQILIDKLTAEYLAVEKALWKKIDTQLILLDRGSLLSEIYHEHSRILSNDFGENRVLWSLGIQKYERLINIVLSIDTNVKNIKDYLIKSEYVKLVDLARNAGQQMQKSAADLDDIAAQRSFWNDLLDVRSICCCCCSFFFVKSFYSIVHNSSNFCVNSV